MRRWQNIVDEYDIIREWGIPPVDKVACKQAQPWRFEAVSSNPIHFCFRFLSFASIFQTIYAKILLFLDITITASSNCVPETGRTEYKSSLLFFSDRPYRCTRWQTVA
jgi:hypothetical protein